MKKHYDFTKGTVLKDGITTRSHVEKAIAESQKTLTSIRLDQDIIKIAKKQAQVEGVGYLTWLNSKLREAVLGEESLSSRVSKLEKAVFKKKTA